MTAPRLAGTIFENVMTLDEALYKNKQNAAGHPYEYKILDNGCIFDANGKEVPHLDVHAFTAIEQPEASYALISKIKRNIITTASAR